MTFFTRITIFAAFLSLYSPGLARAQTGFQAVNASVTGTYNIAVGNAALNSVTTGDQNTAMGNQALYSNTTGGTNTAVGYQALYYNIAGVNNTALGVQALINNTTGWNTAVGSTALTGVTTGGNNTAIGYAAGYGDIATTTGSANTFLGFYASANGANYSNSTAIGAYTIITGNNQIRIGCTSGTNGCPATVSSIGGPAAWTNTSDRRLKKDIADSDLGLAFVEKLRPVSFRMKDGNEWLHYGFIAQDVEKALAGRVTSMVTRDDDAMKTYRMAYTDLIAPLVKAVQEQQQQIEALKAANAKLAHEVEKLTSAPVK